MDAVESDICIVVLVGLPASGKTTFSEFLMVTCCNVNLSRIIGQKNYNVIHVCYDDLVPLISKQEDTWRESRKKVVMAVENIIQLVKARKYSDVENYLFRLKVKSSRKNICQSEKEKLLILIDDNMYYRSMRYEYFKLARMYTTSFVEICLHCTVDEACIRNSQRTEGRVPTDVITAMMSKICCPNINKTSWEKWFCCIYSYEIFDNETAKIVFKVIEDSMKDPVPPLIDKEFTRQNNVPSLIHEADIALRRVVGSRVTELTNTGKGDADHRQSILFKKQILLKDLKDGFIQVPDYVLRLFEEGSSDLQNELQLWWLDLFDDHSENNLSSLNV